MRLLIVGNRAGTNVGGCLERAATSLGYANQVIEQLLAWDGPRWAQRASWRLLDRRPPRMARFGAQVLAACRAWRPDLLLATGAAPLDAAVLNQIGALGICRLNYSTDDPWNPAQRARWFGRALPHYDLVFSPRRANLADFRTLGCPAVQYLPFAYDPALHYPAPAAAISPEADVVFVGSGDRDRVPFIAALARAGLRVALYGTYWERFAPTRPFARGKADVPQMRHATAAAGVALCLVRRANRDGHVMRSFEIPAMAGCMLAEDTAEHRAIFGAEGAAVRYFRSADEMIAQLRGPLSRPDERRRLAHAAHQLVTAGRHTYRDRLETMLLAAGYNAAPAAHEVAR